MMGDHVAYALQACSAARLQPADHRLPVCQTAQDRLRIREHPCCRLGTGSWHPAGMGREAGLPRTLLDPISSANTAREIAIASSFDPALLELVFQPRPPGRQRPCPWHRTRHSWLPTTAAAVVFDQPLEVTLFSPSAKIMLVSDFFNAVYFSINIAKNYASILISLGCIREVIHATIL